MKNRLVALLMAAAMVTGLVACGNQADPKTDESTGKAEKSEEVAEKSEEAVQEELEPIVVDVFFIAGGWSFEDGVHTDEYPGLQYIFEQTGIELNFISYDLDKYAVYVASGEMPDIFSVEGDYKEQMFKSGLAVELMQSGLLEEYCPTYVEKFPQTVQMQTRPDGTGYIYDGQLSLPGTVPKSSGGLMSEIRVDIWKAIGAPEWDNDAEFIEVLKEMQDYQREQTGDDTVYGMTANFTDFFSQNVYPMSKGWSTGGECSDAVNLETYELDRSYTDPDGWFWKGLDFYRAAYQAGVLDPESLTQEHGTACDKFQQGKALSQISWISSPKREIAGEDAIIGALPYGDVNYIWDIYGAADYSWPNWAISSKSEHTERILQLFEFLSQDEHLRVLYNGEKGVDWDYDENGAPVYIGDMLAAFQESKETGIEKLNQVSLDDDGFYFITSPAGPTLDGYPIVITDSVDFKKMYISEHDLDMIAAFDSDAKTKADLYGEWYEAGLVETSGVSELYNLASTISTNPCSDEALEGRVKAHEIAHKYYADLLLADNDKYATLKADVIEEFNNSGIELYYDEVEANLKYKLEEVKRIYGLE